MLKVASAPEARLALALEASVLMDGPRALPGLLAVDGPLELPRALSLELVRGAPLDAGSASRAVVADHLAALESIHRRGLVHGDVKPDHLLVDERGRGRLLDLGLARPLGAPLRGGTLGFVAPEELRGAPASVAGDLFALGRALREVLGGAGQASDPALDTLALACCAEDPEARPLSALACINALGETRTSLELRRSFERRGDGGALAHASSILRASEGASVVVVSEQGAGRRRFIDDLARVSFRTERPLVAVDLDDDVSLLERWAACFGLSLAGEPTRDLGIVATHAARAGLALITIPRTRDALARARVLSVAFARARRGGLVIVAGPDVSNAPGEPADGWTRVALPRASLLDVAHLFEEAGARLDPALVPVVLEASRGRMGVVAAMARRASRSPLGSAAAVLAEVAHVERTERAVPPEGPALPPRELARAGQYAAAVAALRATEAPTSSDRLLLVECLERLGQFAAAREAGVTLADDPLVGAAALAVVAHVTLALGDPSEADAAALRGLARARSPAPREADVGLASQPAAVVGRLHTARSDAALRVGRTGDAIAFAHLALAHAEEHGDAALSAQAHARLGAAHGLSGDPRRAREHHRLALACAERAGDVGRLPAFIMNLATSEHALGELAAALEHYQEAAALAARLGREANLLAATVNLAGLWTSLGARVEAEALLDRADALARSLGDAVYAAQAVLLRAELAADADLAAAAVLAREAERAFSAAGAARQATEAELLVAEVALRAGDAGPASALRSREAELERAGLGGRFALLSAREALRAGRAVEAREHAERAIDAGADDPLLALCARFERGRACEALARGGGADDARTARAALEEIARTLPEGVRSRFLGQHALAEIAALPRGLGVERGDPPRDEPLGGLGRSGRRLLGLVRRLLVEGDEEQVLRAALDEAVELTGAERALLVLARQRGRPEIAAAHNVERATVDGPAFRFSRSVVDRVVATGEAVLTASAVEDPALDRSRSILDLGLRSILAVPIRGPRAVLGALYLDHRLERGRFGDVERELTAALADIVGMALEKTRLVAEAERRADASERHREAAERDRLEKAREVARLADLLRQAPKSPEEQGGIVGRSHKLLAALDVARRVAKSELPVLVRGESGTGKELFARYVHTESARASKPFIAINCGAVPESLLESELFGHERGAFTGAVTDSPGLFRLADGGTLFLDEIGEMPLRMQTRLLRVLQEGEVRPVGGRESVRVDVRVVAATHRDLEEMVGAGSFREDLYRLLGARVRLPPLRERREDILEIARVILARVEARHARRVELSKAAESALLHHPWPGNVRELEQSLVRGALLAEGSVVGPEHLELTRPQATRRVELAGFDRALIEQALLASKGNRTLAAKALGVSRVTLHRWMRRYDVT